MQRTKVCAISLIFSLLCLSSQILYAYNVHPHERYRLQMKIGQIDSLPIAGVRVRLFDANGKKT
jgi:hypothetical protein